MSDHQGPLRLVLDDARAGQPLRSVLEELVGADTDAVLYHGGAWLNKQRIQDGERRVAAGDFLVVSRPSQGVYQDVALTAQQILYEDDDLIAINKPAGMYVDVTPWSLYGNLRVALLRLLAARDGVAPPLHLAHRLDRDTSGLLLLSKSPEVNPALQKLFAKGRVDKRYLAWCAGTPPFNEMLVETGHGRGAHGIFRIYPLEEVGTVLGYNNSTVKLMRTRFRVLERYAEQTLVEAVPLTGRTHQIRLHMAHLGHPLIGDTRYGGPPAAPPGHRLHAARLSFRHPRTNVWIELEC